MVILDQVVVEKRFLKYPPFPFRAAIQNPGKWFWDSATAEFDWERESLFPDLPVKFSFSCCISKCLSDFFCCMAGHP